MREQAAITWATAKATSWLGTSMLVLLATFWFKRRRERKNGFGAKGEKYGWTAIEDLPAKPFTYSFCGDSTAEVTADATAFFANNNHALTKEQRAAAAAKAAAQKKSAAKPAAKPAATAKVAPAEPEAKAGGDGAAFFASNSYAKR